MAIDFRRLKAMKKPEFHRNYRRYYPAESLESIGFTRKVCSKCGRGFWSAVERSYCDEPACSGGYRFIGEKLTKKTLKYKQAWDEYVKVFKKWDYVPIKRYPVVCRWYEDLYFVNAGINDFQPYVVAGEVPPPAPAVLEPQFCLRFQDMDSVGVTGRHYTGFIMVGQHTFNTEKKHVYFKEEGILQMHEFLTEGLGINAEEIFYHEDVWAGGGNYGPSMEFFARGLELGNQVYMQYEVLPDGSSRELKTKVIDMGAGLERWSWFSQGNPMSYDSTFPEVMDHLYKRTGFKFDNDFMSNFGRYCGMLDIDEVDDIQSVWGEIAKGLGLELGELKKRVYELRALYAIADHTRTLLVAIHDGALPSNVGGGYNLRNILRRCWSLSDEFDYGIELEKVFEEHIKEFGDWYTELRDAGSLFDILEVEKKRYEETRQKGKKLIEKQKQMSVEKMVELYDSHGITPDLIHQLTDVEVPDNFYRLVEERHQSKLKRTSRDEPSVPDNIPETKPLYYDDEWWGKSTFTAKVMAVLTVIKRVQGITKGSSNGAIHWVILDRTLFYPEGGGQEADAGTLNGVDVTEALKVAGGVILHKVSDPSKFKKGETVEGVVDWSRRWQLMQHHTATHIVNAAAYGVLGSHVWQAGANKSEKTSRLDITHYKAVSKEELKRIEDRANELVREAHPIEILWMRRNEAEEKYGMRLYQGGAVPGVQLRIVNVVGVDVEACGGTHLKNTSEVGEIKMVHASRIQDGVVRLEFTAGAAADRQASKEEEMYENALDEFGFDVEKRSFDRGRLQNASKVFRVQPEKLASTIRRFTGEVEADSKKVKESGARPVEVKNAVDIVEASEKLFDAWKSNRKLVERLSTCIPKDIECELENAFKGSDVVKKVTSGLNVKSMTEVAKKVVEKPGRLLILVNKDGDKANVVVASSSKHNAGDICARLSRELGGGGKGKPSLAVGGGKSGKVKQKVGEFEV